MLGYVQHSVQDRIKPKPRPTIVIEPTNWKWKRRKERKKMSQQKRVRYAQAQQNPPVHWFDKFPSARRMNWIATKQKIMKLKKSSYMPLPTEMLFFFCSLILATFYCFHFFFSLWIEWFSREVLLHLDTDLTSKTHNYLWWFRHLYFAYCFAFFPISLPHKTPVIIP